MSIEFFDSKKAMRIIGDMNIGGYIYTAGIAGKRFFEALREGKIIASRCPECGSKYLPPRLYCEECFTEIGEYVELEEVGILWSYTVQWVSGDGERLSRPRIWGLIKFNDVTGGMIHLIDEVDVDDVYIGMLVEPVFKPVEERVGSIMDIKYFKPFEEE